MKKVESTIMDDTFIQVKKNSIDQLLKDPHILNILSQYELKREIVEEYWSDFLNYHEDIVTCDHCQGLQFCPKVSKGMKKQLTFQNNEMILSILPCPKGHASFENQDILSQIILKNVEDEILLTKMSDLTMLKQPKSNVKTVIAQLVQIIENPKQKGIYLYGNPGTGKSTLMGFLIRELALRKVKCGYIHFPTYLMDIKSSFGQDSNYIDQLKNVDFLVIDDVGGESATPWSRDEILSSILGYRAQNKKTTCFTSVYGFNDIQQYYITKPNEQMRVARLIDRMKALCNEVALIGSDLR